MTNEERNLSTPAVLLAFLSGAAAGAAIALLAAPRSGQETRDRIVSWAKEGRVTKAAQRAATAARNAFDEFTEGVRSPDA